MGFCVCSRGDRLRLQRCSNKPNQSLQSGRFYIGYIVCQFHNLLEARDSLFPGQIFFTVKERELHVVLLS